MKQFILLFILSITFISCEQVREEERINANKVQLEFTGQGFEYKITYPLGVGASDVKEYGDNIPYFDSPFVDITEFTDYGNYILEFKNTGSISSVIILHYKLKYTESPEWGLSYWVEPGKTRYIEINPQAEEFPIVANYIY